ncbi:MAG: nucleoside-triphosphatase [Deferribacterales bacterium]
MRKTQKPELITSSSKWEKGAVAGGIWGTSEMSLGSLLHNLRIPMKGYILTFIAIILMSGINVRWRQKGLFYRAGLSSALLKLFSPSPNLIVPAIAISVEGFLMELGARIGGNNPIGYAIGGGLALICTILHKFIRAFMMFGPNIYILYEKFFEGTAGLAGLKQIDPIWGIIALLVIYFICGVIASAIGSFTGHNLETNIRTITYAESVPSFKPEKQKVVAASNFKPSLVWLTLAFIVIFVGLVFMHSYPSIIPFLGIYFIFAAIRYSRSLKRLLNPKFFIPVLLISFLSGAFIYAGDSGMFSVKAISGGLAMVFRACLMTIAINGILNEFKHPRIAAAIRRRYGDKMDRTMATAWETNKAMGSIVTKKDIRTSPMSALKQILITADNMLDDIKADVVLVTGGVDAGKTTFMAKEAERLKADFKVCGFVCKANVYADKKDDYRLTDLVSGEEIPFCMRNAEGTFNFSDEAVGKMTEKVIKDAEDAEYVFIDEAGRLEIGGDGWNGLITQLLRKRTTLVVAVRDVFVDDLMDAFGIKRAKVIKAGN